jgi:hypothetical protein
VNISSLFPSAAELAELEARGERTVGGFVYVLAMVPPEGSPVFKIGMASHPDSRVNQLQAVMPFENFLVLVLWAKDALGQEAYLHRYFAEYRLRGEWFRLPDEALIELHGLAETMRADTPASALKHLRALPMEVWHRHKNGEWPNLSEAA